MNMNLFKLIFFFILLQNKIYYVRGFVVDAKIIPRYFPDLTFNSETTINWNAKLVLCLKTSGQLRGKR